MGVASGLLKVTSWKKQTALGTAASGSGGKTARNITSRFTAERETFESDEKTTHHQSTGVGLGMKRIAGAIAGLLSAATYADLFASILEKDFATGVNSTSLTITYGGTAGAWTAARASGSFLTDGFKVGDVIRASGGSVTANNSRNFLVTAVVALTITFRALDGATVTAGSSTTTTLTVHNKKTYAPTTGHTKDYYTFEEYYSDLAKSETFTDCRIGKIGVSVPASGNASISVDVVGLARTLGGSQVLTSPTTTTTQIMGSSNHLVLINGAVSTVATGINFEISNNAQNAGAVIGSDVGADVITGRIRVTGSFTLQFDSTTVQALYDAKTPISITVVLLADNTATSEFIAFTIPKVKLTGDAPDDGEKAVIRTYPFVGEFNSSGGSGTSSEQTILSIQDSNA